LGTSGKRKRIDHQKERDTRSSAIFTAIDQICWLLIAVANRPLSGLLFELKYDSSGLSRQVALPLCAVGYIVHRAACEPNPGAQKGAWRPSYGCAN
jgi:hypothetical protein